MARSPSDNCWIGGPTGTQSYTVLVEDADVQAAGGLIAHWVLFNIPGFITTMPNGGRAAHKAPG